MLAKVRQLYTICYRILSAKTEDEFTLILSEYEGNSVISKLEAYLYEAILSSRLDNLQKVLLNLSKDGIQVYTAWRLNFPLYPKIYSFENTLLNNKLEKLEKQLNEVVLKILVFIRSNFQQLSTDSQYILLPFLSGKVISEKFPYFNSEFKIKWYDLYLTRLEKLLALKVLYFASIGSLEIKGSLFQNKLSNHLKYSNFEKHIYFKNQKVIRKLNTLNDNNTLNYQFLLNSVSMTSDVVGEYPYNTAISIEKKYTLEFATNNVSFKTSEIDEIMRVLSPFFSTIDHPLLRDLLTSKKEKNERKILFQQTSASLIYFFKSLYQDGILKTTSKQKLGNWIMQNFLFAHVGHAREIKKSTVQKYLKPDTKPPTLILSID